MDTKRTYSIKNAVEADDLERWHKDGWTVEYYQFRADGLLDCVAYKDETPAPTIPTQPAVKRITDTVQAVQTPVRILTHNPFPKGDTRPISPLRADIQARREKNQAEIYDIMRRGVEAHKAIDSTFKPMQLGVKPS